MSDVCYLRFEELRRPSATSRPKSLLYPVWVWKILHPSPRKQKLNVFEQGVLGLARAGQRDATVVGGLLGLDSQLVQFIQVELINFGYVDASGRATDSGHLQLVRDTASLDDSRVGYAFQDALTGKWLPRVAERLPEIEPVDATAPYPQFAADRGQGRVDQPFLIRPDRNTPPPIDGVDALREAFRRHRVDLAYATADISAEAPVSSRAEFKIIGEPRPAYLWTWASADDTGTRLWNVTDPWGLSTSVVWLREPLEAQLGKNQALASALMACLPDTDKKPENQTVAAWLQAQDNAVRMQFLCDYPWVIGTPMEGYLATLLRQREEWETLPEAQRHDGELRKLMTEGNNLIESLLRSLLQRQLNLPHAFRLTVANREWAMALRRLDSLQFLSDKTLKNFLQPVREAFESQGDGAGAKPLLLAHLLLAADQPEHPFNRLPPSDLQIERIYQLVTYRNKTSGHATAKPIEAHQTLEYTTFLLSWITLFKPSSPAHG